MRSPAHTDDPCLSTLSDSITRLHRSTCASRSPFRRMRSGMRCATFCACRTVKEAAILSTCNRTELYVHSPEPRPIVTWLEDFHHVPKDSLSPYLFTLPREKAVTHAFRVASGLDSMVLGEPQILGQMKQAVRHAESAGTLGLVLNRLFQRTFAVAKDVRTQTDIGSASISMAAASVKLAERIFPSIARAAAAPDRRRRDDRAHRGAFCGAPSETRSRSRIARSSAAARWRRVFTPMPSR